MEGECTLSFTLNIKQPVKDDVNGFILHRVAVEGKLKAGHNLTYREIIINLRYSERDIRQEGITDNLQHSIFYLESKRERKADDIFALQRWTLSMYDQ